jgi:hypothetical protein
MKTINESKLNNIFQMLFENKYFGNIDETEGTDSYGYHAGDLQNKTETLGQRNFNITNLGHMGTGFYFYGDLDQALDHATGFGQSQQGEFSETRPVMKVDFSKYNLYDARNNASEFYETMKSITVGFSKVNDTFFTSDQYKAILQDVHGALSSMGISVPVDKLDNDLQDFTYDLIDKEDGEMLASRIMKSAGYEGVDVRGSELDNFGVGSIIFDIKPNSVEKVNYKQQST